jgi:hypothetical protein
MSEFQPNPEADLEAQISEADRAIFALDDEILLLRSKLERGELPEIEYDMIETQLGIEAKTKRNELYQLLLSMGAKGIDEIEKRLTEFVRSFEGDFGEDVPIAESEMLYSVFNPDLSEPLDEEVKHILEKLRERFFILSDDEALEDENIAADPDWQPPTE